MLLLLLLLLFAIKCCLHVLCCAVYNIRVFVIDVIGSFVRWFVYDKARRRENSSSSSSK